MLDTGSSYSILALPVGLGELARGGEVACNALRLGDHRDELHAKLALRAREDSSGLLLFFRVDDFNLALQRAWRVRPPVGVS